MAWHDDADLNREPAGLGNSEEQYRLLFESNPLPMWVFDRQSFRFLAVNEAATRKYGFTEQEFLAMTVAGIRPAEDVAAMMEDLEKHGVGLQERGVWRHSKKNGEMIDVEIACHNLEFRGIAAMLVCAQDITERKHAAEKLRNSEKRYRALFEESADANFLIGEHRVLDWNSAALEMFGYSAGELMPHPIELSPPTQADGTPSKTAGEQKIIAAIQNGREHFEWLHQHKDGSIFPVEVSLTALTLDG